MKSFAIAVAALGLTATAAMAQSTTNFADLDIDANGELSFEEVTVVWTELTQEEFTAADADGSGELSAEEVATMQGPATAAPAPAAPTDDMSTAPLDAPALNGAGEESGFGVDANGESAGDDIDEIGPQDPAESLTDSED